MSEYPYTTEELAHELRINVKTLRRKARALGIGIGIGGRAGYRYSAADRAQLIGSMRPAAPVDKRDKRSRRGSRAA